MADEGNVDMRNTHTLSRQVDPEPEARVTGDTGALKRTLSLLSLEDEGRVPLFGSVSHLKKIKKLVVANRGEIAIRVCRAASELQLPTVGIYAKEDAYAMHRFRPDESYMVGEGLGPLRPYLEIPEIIRVCKESGANAVHPGYGFLSENADFVKACTDNGIIFVGPSEAAIRALGDKVSAREIALASKVPVVPGTDGPCGTVEEAQAFAKAHGFPLLIKAAFGGGGRGMRVVTAESELADAFASATREATSAFGNGMCFIERYLPSPRHIEVQILGDNHGGMVHLFERDCSVQRRHQKVVEIAPASSLPDEVRAAILADAIKVCKHVKYSNAGTVEFLYDPTSGKHYFIEVNPRVQVEHTVTECVTGVDIVKSQICIADGYTLDDIDLKQDELQVHGNAIQVRITTEDPKAGFKPDTGRVHVYRSPGGVGIRLDSSMTAGSIVSPHYDSLMVKLTAHGRTYPEAMSRVSRALAEFRLRGVKTNIPFLQKVISHPTFVLNECTTTFIDDTPELFEFNSAQDKTTRLLTYLSDVVINGSVLKDERLYPDPSVHPVVPEVAPGPPPAGWRGVLLEKGPEGFAKAVREHGAALITDTTWRDAHQSLLATRVRTVDLMNIAPATARALAPCFSLESWGGATFDVCLRFLHECPWERLKRLRAEVPNIPFQMLLRGANAVGYTSYPDNVVNKFVQKAKDCGMDIFRVFDSLNYIPNLEVGIKAIHLAGGVVEAVVCYTGDVLDPACEYSTDYYLGKVAELVELKIHILAIKDMAGLLKPAAATKLVGAIRAKFPALPIHVHTHDTAGTGVATLIAAVEAGADVVDCATDALSGLTSQPSLGAVVNALRNGPHASELEPSQLIPINDYWEETRRLYRGFESTDLRSGNSDVYQHEMPGGQYTNLQFQAGALGLVGRWPAIKRAYAEANKLCGNIIKVTPSSKVIGDLAQFMVANNLSTAAETSARASTLDFPQSVVSFFQGYLGQPHNGFPPELRKAIIKDLPEINERPGASMAPFDFDAARAKLTSSFPEVVVSELDVVSYSLYPKVTEDFLRFRHQYGDLGWLPTHLFLRPMDIGQEIEIPHQDERDFSVRLLAVGRLLEGGEREVFWEVNGKPRLLTVEDTQADKIAADVVARKKATDAPGSIGAPMTGVIIEFKVEEGQSVTAGEPVCVLSAMKMETIITSPVSGVVDAVYAGPLESVSSGDLLLTVIPDAGAKPAA